MPWPLALTLLSECLFLLRWDLSGLRFSRVDSGVPEEDREDGQLPDPLQHAERAFEEHEADLIEQLTTLAQRGIPKDATVREAMIEMRRAMKDDPDAQELVERLVAIMRSGAGNVAENWVEWRRENRPLD